MRQGKMMLFAAILCMIFSLAVHAGENSPWGSSRPANMQYKPAKVVYDLFSGNKYDVISIFDRASYLYKLQGSDPFDSSIVIIIHGEAVPFFAIKNYKKYKDIVTRAQSLTVGTTIEFRMCQAAARLMELEPKDIHGFVKMVPMADAELVRLQHEGYAYMQ